MSKLIALMLSFFAFVSGFNINFLATALDNVLSIITGIPFLENSINDDFLDSLSQENIKLISRDTAFRNNLVMFVTQDDASILEKRRVLKENDLTLLGWCCQANFYIASCSPKSYLSLKNLSDGITENYDFIIKAMPVELAKIEPTYTPNDEMWRGNGYNAYEQINAREAWNYSEYFNPIKVGVIDDGFNTQHEELAGDISFPGCLAEKRNRPSKHGTAVASVITAKHNNSVGFAGICDNAQIIAYDWLPQKGQIWNETLSILFGFLRLVKSGGKVINMSLGISNAIKENPNEMRLAAESTGTISSLLMSVMLGKGFDFVVVQSAGNGDSKSRPVDSFYSGFFCSVNPDTIYLHRKVRDIDIYSRIIIVTSSNLEGQGNASFANYGDTVDIAAPGEEVFVANENHYYTGYGTSFSAPLAAGTAALIWSINPNLTGAQVKEMLISSSTEQITHEVSGELYPLLNCKTAVEKAVSTLGAVSRIKANYDEQELARSGDFITVTIDGISKKVSAPNGELDLIYIGSGVTIKADSATDENGYEEIYQQATPNETVDLGLIPLPPPQGEGGKGTQKEEENNNSGGI